MAAGRTVLFATHRLEEADAFADRVVVPARGRLLVEGTPAQVRAQAASPSTVSLEEAFRVPSRWGTRAGARQASAAACNGSTRAVYGYGYLVSDDTEVAMPGQIDGRVCGGWRSRHRGVGPAPGVSGWPWAGTPPQPRAHGG